MSSPAPPPPRGERLIDRTARRPLLLREAVRIVRDLARAAGKLHEQGLAHGDIKPENIRFSEHPPEIPILSEIPAEADPLHRRRLTRDAVRFFAPEQVLSGQADARADVYSLAAVLYFHVAGCLPVRDPAEELGQRAVLRGPLAQPLAEVRPDASKELCALVDRALSLRPADRPANGTELADALSAIEPTLGPAGQEGPFPLTIDAAGRRALPRPPPPMVPLPDSPPWQGIAIPAGTSQPVPPAAVGRALTAAEKEAWRIEQERVRMEYAKLHARAEARLAAMGRRARVTPEHEISLPAGGRTDGWGPADVMALEDEKHPSPARIDEVGQRLASSIEAHVIDSLRGEGAAWTGSRFVAGCSSGLPMWTRRYLDRFRPSQAVPERLELAIFVMSELLAAGYGYTHQVEDFKWEDATGFFLVFRDIAHRW